MDDKLTLKLAKTPDVLLKIYQKPPLPKTVEEIKCKNICN